MREPNGAREAGAFSDLDQSYWLPLCRVQATPEVQAVPNFQIGKLRGVKSLPWVTPKKDYSVHHLLPGAWTSHHLSGLKKLWPLWPGFQVPGAPNPACSPGRQLDSLFTEGQLI